MKSDAAKDLEDTLTPKRERPRLTVPSKDLLSTGSTLVNLACSGRTSGGFGKGMYYLVVGDTNSGKSWLTMNCLAEAAINPNFDDYRFVCDSPEGGAKMDVEYFFGQNTKKRIESPARNKDGTPRNSTTVEEFYYNLDDALKHHKPCIYILDSVDTLYCQADEDKFQQQKRAHTRRINKEKTKEEEKVAGSYGTQKARVHSQELRKIPPRLEKTGSILIVINQTRDAIGGASYMREKTRAGGNALEFWASIQMWLSIKEKIKKRVGNKDRKIGIMSKVVIKRTRLTGRDHTVFMPIYAKTGIDDLGSMVDYLISEDYWKSEGKENPTVKAPEFDYEGRKELLIQKIDQEDRHGELQNLVKVVWNDIEDQCSVRRRRRYQ